MRIIKPVNSLAFDVKGESGVGNRESQIAKHPPWDAKGERFARQRRAKLGHACPPPPLGYSPTPDSRFPIPDSRYSYQQQDEVLSLLRIHPKGTEVYEDAKQNNQG